MPAVRFNRRWLIVAAGAIGFAGMSTSALAQEFQHARRARRPLLTPGNLNRAIPAPGASNHRAFMLEAAADVRAFVRRRFTLTAQQEATLAAIPDLELRNLQAMLRRAAASGASVEMDIADTESARRRPGQPTPPRQERIQDLQSKIRELSEQGSCEKFGRWVTINNNTVMEEITLDLDAVQTRESNERLQRATP